MPGVWVPVVGAVIFDANRYLVGGRPRAVVLPARICRALDVVLNDYRLKVRGLDAELSAVLGAVHEAALEWDEHRATSESGSSELPANGPVKSSPHARELDAVSAAKRIGCSDRNVRDLCIRGQLPGRKVGGRWLIDAAALDGYLADRAS